MHPLNRVLMATAAAAVMSASLLAAPAQATEGNASGGQGQENGSAAGHNDGDNGSRSPFSFAVIGDVPYGDAEIQAFPSYIQDINAHKELSFVGARRGHQERLLAVHRRVLRRDPEELRHVHPAAGLHARGQRMDRLPPHQQRRLQPARTAGAGPRNLLPQPGTTLGAPMKVKSQARQGFPENVNFQQAGHRLHGREHPGSNNSMLPWSGLGNTAPTAEQLGEVRAAHRRRHPGTERNVPEGARERRPGRRRDDPGRHVRPDSPTPTQETSAPSSRWSRP